MKVFIESKRKKKMKIKICTNTLAYIRIPYECDKDT